MGLEMIGQQSMTRVWQDPADPPAAPWPAQRITRGTHRTQGPNNLQTTTSDSRHRHAPCWPTSHHSHDTTKGTDAHQGLRHSGVITPETPCLGNWRGLQREPHLPTIRNQSLAHLSESTTQSLNSLLTQPSPTMKMGTHSIWRLFQEGQGTGWDTSTCADV